MPRPRLVAHLLSGLLPALVIGPMIGPMGGGVLPSAQAQGPDFGVRIQPEGLDQLEPLIQGLLPESFPVAAIEANLFDCPGSDIVAHIPDLEIMFPEWHAFDLSIVDESIVVEAEVDIELTTMIRIDEVYACFGTANCDLYARADKIRVRLELAAGTGAEGGIELHGVNVSIALAPEDFEIDSDGCAAGDAAEWLIEAFEGRILDRVLPIGEEFVSESLGTALAGVLKSTVNLSAEVGDFGIEGGIGFFAIDPTGITLSGEVGVQWIGASAFEAAAPSMSEASGSSLPAMFGPGAFQVAASDELVTAALYEAWRGGMIHGLVDGLAPTVELPSEGIAQQLGLTEGATLTTSVDLTRPLVARFGREEENQAEIRMEGVKINLGIRIPGQDVSEVEVQMDGTLRAELTVDPSLGALVLSVHTLDVGRMTIDSDAGLLTADPARMRQFISSTVTPMLAERLRGIPVAPALQPVLGSFVHLRALESRSGWQRLAADLVTPDPNDSIAPATFFDERTDVVPAGTASFHVSGEDNETPSELLRFRAWLDGEMLGDGTPKSIRAIRFDVADGEHELRVAAVDLNGNEDPDGATRAFIADGTPPELEVFESPQPLNFDGPIKAAWSVTDDRGGDLESRWELRAIGEDGTSRVVQEERFSTGLRELSAGNLVSDTLYELEIVARDEAGNLTSQVFGFVNEPGASDCSASGSSELPLWISGLLLLLVLGSRRRRGAGPKGARARKSRFFLAQYL